eukprot:7932853-Pyramimonas_sp.AAC.1
MEPARAICPKFRALVLVGLGALILKCPRRSRALLGALGRRRIFFFFLICPRAPIRGKRAPRRA